MATALEAVAEAETAEVAGAERPEFRDLPAPHLPCGPASAYIRRLPDGALGSGQTRFLHCAYVWTCSALDRLFRNSDQAEVRLGLSGAERSRRKWHTISCALQKAMKGHLDLGEQVGLGS